MNFITEQGGKLRISLADPLEELDSEDVEEAMETIIAKDVFTSKTGNVAAIHSARVVSKTIEDLITG